MINNTTIQLPRNLVEELKAAKEYPRQPYNELISKMLHLFKTSKQHNHYDRFLYEIQRQKMKELWDNKDDEVWEDA